jgi:hypothetical protein
MRGQIADDPLLEAIAALREDLDRLFNEHRSRLGLHEGQVLAASGSLGPQARTATQFGARQGGWTETNGRVSALASSANPSPALPALETDPRNRLDALARHLDDRLRRRREPGPDRPESGTGH